MISYLLLGALVGGILGYFVFYFRYENKGTINDLRSNLKVASKEVHHLQSELEEFLQQNTLLKEEVTQLLAKNDDLTDVVTELSKYYVHLKKASEKSVELNKYLHDPNPEVQEKMQKFIDQDKSKIDTSFF